MKVGSSNERLTENDASDRFFSKFVAILFEIISYSTWLRDKKSKKMVYDEPIRNNGSKNGYLEIIWD